MDSNDGAYIGGDVTAGGNFTGRDENEYSHDNNINIKLGDTYRSQQVREEQSLPHRVRSIELFLYGDDRSGEPGLIKQVRTQAQAQLHSSRINTALLVIVMVSVFFLFLRS